MYYMYYIYIYSELHQAESPPNIFKHVTTSQLQLVYKLSVAPEATRATSEGLNLKTFPGGAKEHDQFFPSLTKNPVTTCIDFNSAGYMHMYFNYERLQFTFNLLPVSFVFIIRTHT